MILSRRRSDFCSTPRGYAPAVVTKGGRIVSLAGHNVTPDANGKIVGDFQAQAREAFALMDRTLKALRVTTQEARRSQEARCQPDSQTVKALRSVLALRIWVQ